MKLKVFTAFSGYDSQCMALDKLGIDYELVGWSEIDKYAIQAHNAVYPQWADRNFGDISKIDWNEVPDFDLFTYSFPCQDISSAGKQRGLQKGSETRSSLLWECQKAIEAKRPKYCLMENVAALVSEKFRPFFLEWERLMCRYGYVNYNKVLNAKDYGIPQNRERIFMVSVLDPNKAFYWPEPMKLEKRLKDVLEQNVDEKYYLSDRMIKGFLKTDANKSHGHNFNPKDGDGIAFTIRTAPGSRVDDTFIKELTSVQKDNLLAEPLRIPQATKKGFIEVMQGGLFDMSYPESKTRGGRVQEGGMVSPTLMASSEGACLYEGKEEQSYRIRKLTPKECFRLMGVSEGDIEKIQKSGVSQSQQYKMAGNSIVVDVLEHIFRKLFVDTGQESQQLLLF